MTSVEAALRRDGAVPAIAAATGLLLLVPATLAGIPFVAALVLAVLVGAAVAAAALAMRPRLATDDPLAPTAFERWLCDNDDDWPWWVLGGVTALVGLLLVTSPTVALPLLLVGGVVAVVPGVRRLLAGCGRLA